MKYANVHSVTSMVVACVLVAPLLFVSGELLIQWWRSDELVTTSDGAFDGFALFASLIIGTASALLAVVIGAAFALVFRFGQVPLASWWKTILLVPFLCPPTAWAMAVTACYGTGGWVERTTTLSLPSVFRTLDAGNYVATVVLLAILHAPLAMLIVGRGLTSLSSLGWDAARLHLRSWRLVVWLVRALRYELLSAFLLAFVLGLGSFAVPHVLQCKLYTLGVYMRMTNYLDATGAFMTALPLIVITIGATLAFVCLQGRAIVPNVTEESTHASASRASRIGSVVGLTIYITVVIVLPMLGLVSGVRSVETFVAAGRSAMPETMNSLGIAASAALLVVVTTLAMTWRIDRRENWMTRWIVFLPLGVPTLLIGLLASRFFNRSEPIALHVVGDSSWLVIYGLAMRCLPFATQIIFNAQQRRDPHTSDAARLASVGLWHRLRWIHFPQMAAPSVVAFVVCFTLSLGDVEISQMLCAPGEGTLSLRLFTFLHFGPTYVASSLALLLIILSAAVVLMYFAIFNREPTVI